MVSPKSRWGYVLFGGKLQIDAKNLNFKNFESALYMKSGSMPLIVGLTAPKPKFVLPPQTKPFSRERSF